MTGTAPPANLDTTKATLTRQTSEEGAAFRSPRARGRLPTARQTPFPGKPDPDKLCLKDGFDPASLYELTYVAKDPLVHGIGFAATRDLSRSCGARRRQSAGRSVRYAIAQGTSQSGNYLRSFLNLGFNQDECSRRVFDGMNPNIAARQLAMNIRFAAPSGAAEMFEPGSEGVLWWDDYTDKARGTPRRRPPLRDVALPARARRFSRRSAPPSSGAASPRTCGDPCRQGHPSAANVRRYYFPGTTPTGAGGVGSTRRRKHTGPSFELADQPEPADRDHASSAGRPHRVGRQGHRPRRRAGIPRSIAAGQLGPARHIGPWASRSTPVPTATRRQPVEPIPATTTSVRTVPTPPTFRGSVSVQPPVIRQKSFRASSRRSMPMGTIRSASVPSVLHQEPLGTYVGWNEIGPRGFFKGQNNPGFSGGYIPFAKTKADRLDSGDPRPSLEKRCREHTPGTSPPVGKAAADRLVEPAVPVAGRRRSADRTGGEQQRVALRAAAPPSA